MAMAGRVPVGQENMIRFKHAKISVWWDQDRCPLPKDANATEIANRIQKVMNDFGLLGPIDIRSFSDLRTKVQELDKKIREETGEKKKITKKKRQKNPFREYDADDDGFDSRTRDTIKELDRTAVRLVHVDQGEESTHENMIAEEYTLEEMIAAMKHWKRNNRPPLVYLLITSNSGFLDCLVHLKDENHMMMLARPRDRACPSALYPHCAFVWDWDDLAITPQDESVRVRPLNSQKKEKERRSGNV